MNWPDAIAAMQRGQHVQRTSQRYRALIGRTADGIPIYECGTEPMRLAAAWTHDGRPVTVFQGAGSKSLFVPDADDVEACDWEVAP